MCGGTEIDVEKECEIGGTLLRFLSPDEAYKLYLTSRGAAFSDGAVYEEGGKIIAQLKEGESAALCGKTLFAPRPCPAPVLKRVWKMRLKYNSYMFSFGKRAYYKLTLPKVSDCDDMEITLAFGGLNLQMFCRGKIVDDCFNTNGFYTFRLSGVGRHDEYVIRVCAPTSFGGGNVYNEISLTPGNTFLAVHSFKRIKEVCI